MKKKIPVFGIVCFLIGIVFIQSCKKDPEIPVLTTNDVLDITINSVTTGGSIISDGRAEITARGVCWSTSANPDITGSHSTDNTGIGNFVSNITGLTPNTLYYIRAYATNKVGTAYGNEVSFTTTPIVVATLTTSVVTTITLTSAIAGGNITSDGFGAITIRGICWATTANPTVANDTTMDVTGTGSFVSYLDGLLPGTTYYVRSYATNSAGTAYGNELSFPTTSIAVPTLTTAEATSVTLTSAVSGGDITYDGGATVTARGVCWATTLNPTTANSKTTNGTGTGAFTSNISGLSPGVTYHVRAYAINSAGTAYGNDIEFPTGQIIVPALTTNTPGSFTQTSAVSGGNITADGGGSVTARGVCWATTTNPTTANSKTTDGTGTGAFTSNLTGLTPGTPYYVRAYATNSAGTAYGDEKTFTTNPVLLATLTTAAVTSITQTTAVSGGNITANDGGTITARGVCWATTANPTTANSNTTNGTGTGAFTSNLTGLTSGTSYHVRSYATNSAGTAYGNDILFPTDPATPAILTTNAVTSIDVTTAISGGVITSDGNGFISAKGVCWSTTPNPDINDNTTSDGTGAGSFTSNLTLVEGTHYYVRAYATNSAGTAYGGQVSFNSKMDDIDGNKYNTVTIGTQTWMQENLKTTRYRGGALIGTTATPTSDISGESTPSYQWPDFDIDMNDVTVTYGRLYTWYAVTDPRNVCPSGWHVPTYAELGTLISSVGTESDAGAELKEAGLTHWQDPNSGATNSSGFTSLPAGYRKADGTDAFVSLHVSSNHWSTDPNPYNTDWAWGLHMIYDNITGVRWGFFKNAGCSVRCLKD